MKKYQKAKCMKRLSQQSEALERKKETIKKGVTYYQAVDERT